MGKSLKISLYLLCINIQKHNIMTNKKYTKKASAYIMKYLLKNHPDASKLTSFDQAFDILMEDWSLEIDIYTNTEHHTKVNLYREENIIHTFEWDNIDTEEPADLNWNILYKDVLEFIIKKKLYKTPKFGKRVQKKLDEQKNNKEKIQEELEIQKEPFVAVTPEEMTKDKMKRKKASLYQKIREWRIKGKDVTELVKEYNEISNKLKS